MSRNPQSYTDLKARLDALATSLLPEPSLVGRYTAKEKDLIHAYVLLAHAEIETFCEQIALDAVLRAQRKSKSGKCEKLISRLIFVYAAKKQENLEPFSESVMIKACENYKKDIDQNHGVKARNVLRIFLPLGLRNLCTSSLLASCLHKIEV
jgi:hypothetical protein